MTSYAEYVEQIAKLQSLAEAARKDVILPPYNRTQPIV